MTDVELINFVSEQIKADLASGDIKAVRVRFPPEPNGYLHLGHAKSILLNFGLAQEFKGECYLRFDDTNPATEEPEYVKAIQEDLSWLLNCPELVPKEPKYTSNYFDVLYELAHYLIDQGLAYVCDLSPEEIVAHRGTSQKAGPNLTAGSTPDKPCPARNTRSPKENKELFTRMYHGEFEPGTKTLRAKIDLASPNPNLRDPIMYRIISSSHHRTENNWHIYPTYDWAHGQSDAIEGITHSICTLEFENHRALYNWFLENLRPVLEFPERVHLANSPKRLPHQIEFARLNVQRTVMSKRKLKDLVTSGQVTGWDDPRLPTLRGMRRRGWTPSAIAKFCQVIGVSKNHNVIELSQLETCLREDLDPIVPRRLVVTRPLKVIVENYPVYNLDDLVVPGEEWFRAPNHPAREEFGERRIPFSKELWIEREDFMIEPSKKYFRLFPGNEVRFRYAYLATCTGYEVDEATGEVACVKVRIDPASRGGNAPDGRKVKGTIGWVSAHHSHTATVKLYDSLFVPRKELDESTKSNTELNSDLDPEELVFNPKSEECLLAQVEPLVIEEQIDYYQFERQGYFYRDPDDHKLFHRSVTLRDTWAKLNKKPVDQPQASKSKNKPKKNNKVNKAESKA